MFDWDTTSTIKDNWQMSKNWHDRPRCDFSSGTGRRRPRSFTEPVVSKYDQFCQFQNSYTFNRYFQYGSITKAIIINGIKVLLNWQIK